MLSCICLNQALIFSVIFLWKCLTISIALPPFSFDVLFSLLSEDLQPVSMLYVQQKMVHCSKIYSPVPFVLGTHHVPALKIYDRFSTLVNNFKRIHGFLHPAISSLKGTWIYVPILICISFGWWGTSNIYTSKPFYTYWNVIQEGPSAAWNVQFFNVLQNFSSLAFTIVLYAERAPIRSLHSCCHHPSS